MEVAVDTVNPQMAVKGLAILAALPVVILALWADYFGRAVSQRHKTDPLFEREPELNTARLAGLLAIVAQFFVFMGTAEVRTESPILANLIFVLAVLAQSSIIRSLEKKLPGRVIESLKPLSARVQTPPQDPVASAGKAFFWAMAGGAMYVGVLLGSVATCIFFAKVFHASTPVTSALVIGGSIVGVLGGLGLNFALGAFHLSRMLPVQPIEEPGMRTLIESLFTRAGLPVPRLWMIEAERVREANAMIAGFKNGKGIFRPGFFITRCTLESLNPGELEAVVLHEISHLQMGHLSKRLIYSASLIFLTTAAATFCVFLSHIFLPASSARDMVGVAAAAAAFVITFKLLGKQSRQHELQADAYSVEKLGASLEDLSSSLRKLDQINSQDPMRGTMTAITSGSSHPSTEQRLAALQARFGTSNNVTPLPSKSEDRKDKAA